MAAHSKLGFSGAHRYINCHGSVNLIGAGHDKDDSSEFSARGNVAHDIASQCLKGEMEPWEAEYLYGRIALRDIPYGKQIEEEDLR